MKPALTNLQRADAATDPAEKAWWLSATKYNVFSCPGCGNLRRCFKSRYMAFVYICPDCKYFIDERLHYSQRRLRQVDGDK